MTLKPMSSCRGARPRTSKATLRTFQHLSITLRQRDPTNATSVLSRPLWPLNRRRCATGKGLGSLPWANTYSKTWTRLWRLHEYADPSQTARFASRRRITKCRSVPPSDTTYCVWHSALVSRTVGRLGIQIFGFNPALPEQCSHSDPTWAAGWVYGMRMYTTRQGGWLSQKNSLEQ